jgi:trk system potassium uptake protein TrkH
MSKLLNNYLSFFLILISFFSLINITYCYYFNIYLNVDTYIYTLIISLILGFGLLSLRVKILKINIYHKILTVISGYFLIPLIISIPYYLSIYNISFLNCYFEAISGFTSTGFSIFENIRHLDESLILWRSTSQWIGGIYFLFSIILLIDIFDDRIKNSLTNFISLNNLESFKQYIKIFILYFCLTTFIFFSLNIINIRTFDSLNLSMTIISSGGFLPFNNLDIILNTNLKQIVFSLLMLFSFFSLFLTYNLLFVKKKNLNFFAEDIYLLVYLGLISVFFLVFLNFDYNFSLILFSITSSISNIGISLSSVSSNLYIFFLILVIIGGSYFSTSSGIRFVKLFALLKFSLNEILSYTKPNYVFTNKFQLFDKNVELKDIHKYFLTLIVFIISLFLLTILLTFSELNFENSFKIGILTLMNTTTSEMYGLSDLNFYELNFYTKLILILFMTIGRFELITLLIIIKKFFFR